MIRLKKLKQFLSLLIFLAVIDPCYAVIKKIVINNVATFQEADHKKILKDPTPSLEERLVGFVQKMITSLRYSSYKLGGTRFDTLRGIYILDCSTYVDHLLEKVYPKAYSNLVEWSGSEKPTTHDYYHFFTRLYDRPQRYWYGIRDIQQLRAGDIIVFRYRKKLQRELAGHIMVVMDRPTREKNSYLVRVADSAPYRHSKDTRKLNMSGIGIGTLLLKVDPKTYQPYAYAWKVGSRWKKNVNFAMARPAAHHII